MNNSTAKKYCAKCLSLLKSNNKIIDMAGNEFCSKVCMQDWWAEERKNAEEIYDFFKKGM